MPILLLPLKSGANGLNLIEANQTPTLSGKGFDQKSFEKNFDKNKFEKWNI